MGRRCKLLLCRATNKRQKVRKSSKKYKNRIKKKLSYVESSHISTRKNKKAIIVYYCMYRSLNVKSSPQKKKKTTTSMTKFLLDWLCNQYYTYLRLSHKECAGGVAAKKEKKEKKKKKKTQPGLPPERITKKERKRNKRLETLNQRYSHDGNRQGVFFFFHIYKNKINKIY